MEVDPAKVYVGGIGPEIDEDTLRDHFSHYGEVMNCLVLQGRDSWEIRRFGFVTFTDPSMVEKVLEAEHVIHGTKVDVRPAKPKAILNGQGQNDGPCNQCSYSQSNPNKIFVGGLPTITEEEFKGHFASFGTITDAVVIYDKLERSFDHKPKPRGFGFITFDSKEAVDNVLKKQFYELNGKRVEVKRAEPKKWKTQEQNNSFNGQNTGFGFGTWLPMPYYPWYPHTSVEFTYLYPQRNLYVLPCQAPTPHVSPVFYTFVSPVLYCNNTIDSENSWAMNNADGYDNRKRNAIRISSPIEASYRKTNGSTGNVDVKAVIKSPQIDNASSSSSNNTIDSENSWAMNNADGYDNRKRNAIRISSPIDTSYRKTNGSTGNVDVKAVIKSPQIDNASSSSSKQEHQHQ